MIILVRRDNVEHLLIIGGPSDVVVEASIARAAPPADDAVLPRAIPLPESGLRSPQPVASWSRRALQIEPEANEPLDCNVPAGWARGRWSPSTPA